MHVIGDDQIDIVALSQDASFCQRSLVEGCAQQFHRISVSGSGTALNKSLGKRVSKPMGLAWIEEEGQEVRVTQLLVGYANCVEDIEGMKE